MSARTLEHETVARGYQHGAHVHPLSSIRALVQIAKSGGPRFLSNRQPCPNRLRGSAHWAAPAVSF